MTPEEFQQLAAKNIFPGESGGDYNALFGYSNREGEQFGGTNLTDMTVNDALQFAQPSGPYGQWVKGQVGHVATPMGAYQVVGTTLRAAQEGLGLTGNERMTPELQDQIGQWIYQTQGPGAWEGWAGDQVSTRGTVDTPQAVAQDTRSALGLLNDGGPQVTPQQQQPRGLLESMGIQKRDPNAEGETSKPFYQRERFGDVLASLAPAFGRMGVMGLEEPAQAALAARRSRQGQSAQVNKTREWLLSQPGGEKFAGMIEAAGPQSALQAYMQSQQGPDQTSAMQNYQYLLSQGASPQDAMERAFSGGTNIQVGGDGAPQAQVGTIPPGFQAVPDGQGGFVMSRIPGGPAEAEAAAAETQNAEAAARAQSSVQLIDEIINDPALESITGIVQGRLPPISQEGENLNVKIDQLKGQAFLQAFESLKGGGQITEREGTAATEAMARLRRTQGTPEYAKSLTELRYVMDRAARRAAGEDVGSYNFDSYWSQRQGPSAPTAAPSNIGGSTLTFNPETGGFD